MKQQVSMNYNNILPTNKLVQLARENSVSYAEAKPYSHIVLDNVFEDKLLDGVLTEFEDSDKWKEFDTKYEKKLQMNKDENLGPITRAFVHNLNSAPFLDFLEVLTGIKGLIPDPHLAGGGLHKIPLGGKLGIHIDFNQYKKLKLFRRINVLVYLNKDWKEEYGGHFELWSDKKGTQKTKVLPVFNRMAIFTTTSSSYHGHPDPLKCPEDRSRRSLALYYYTVVNGGEQSSKEHSTIFITKDGKTEELGRISLWKKIKRKIKNQLF